MYTAARVASLVLSMVSIVLTAARPAAGLDPSRRLTDYAHDAWKMIDGLPQDSITAIRQTRDGYLWLGTLDGLVRFDGVRFETFNLIHRAGMEGNVVLALAEGPDASLWIGTRSGLARYQAGRFTVYGRAEGLTDLLVRAIVVDRQGSVWFGTRGGGLHRWREGRFSVWTTADGLASNDVRALLEEGDGAILAGTAAGLHRLRGGTMAPVPLGSTPDQRLVLSLGRQRDGTVHVGTAEGLWTIPPGGSGQVSGPRLLAGRQVRAITEDEAGSVWAGTNVGLVRTRGSQVEEATSRDGLTHSDVRSLEVDREGSLWIGTDGGGLNRFTNASVVMVRSNLSRDSDTLMAVYQDAAGVMWAAANCGGVIRWADGRPTAITVKDGLPDDCTRALAGGPDGSIWAGTAAGLARIHRGGVTRLTTANGLSSNRVMAIVVDRHGVVWAGSTDGGVDRIEHGRITHYNRRTGLSNEDVRALLESRDGAIWVGTFGGGVNRIEDGAVKVYTKQDGLSNNNVLALHEDPDGTLWIGTNGGGLNRLRGGVFTQYTAAHGLFSDGISRILDDGRGSLWMGCNRGIFTVSRRDLDEFARGERTAVRSVSFGVADGLKPGGVIGGAQPAGWRDRAGRLWFPTIAGMAMIDPARLVKNTVPPLVHVEQVVVDRRAWTREDPLVFPAGSREVEFHYTATSLVAPDKVLFRYRLDGFDPDWVDVGTRRTAYFTNLAPGTYRFHVRACNNDGVWNDTGTEAAFVVKPWFYQTAWFLWLSLGLAGTLIWGAYRWRVRQIRAHEQELARQVEQALAENKVLSGLLPICAACKRIRDEQGEWSQLETYIHQHSQAQFSHGICPDCVAKLYPDFAKNRPA